MEKYKFYIHLTLYFIGFYIFIAVIGGSVIYFTYIQSAKTYLETTVARVKDDIKYSNGQWDTFNYNSDPTLPGGNPLYILTIDGYIIDRWRPIVGLLYTLDINYLLQFKTPQTVSLNPHELWRMYTLPIEKDKKILGAVAVSIYNPTERNMEEIDNRLKEDAQIILSQIQIVDEELDVSRVDIRKTGFDTAIRIADKYNTLLAKSNNSNSIDRTPSVIDRSYIAAEIQQPGYRQVKDSETGEPFFILSSPFIVEGEVVGLVVAGYPLMNVYLQLKNYAIYQSIALLIASLINWFIIRRYIIAPRQVLNIRNIEFQKKENKLIINDAVIEIPEDTNQHVLCDAILGKPQKKWTAEEISVRFEDSSGNPWRKVYDAMVLVNKKVEPELKAKLIVVKDAEFYVNPRVIPYVHK